MGKEIIFVIGFSLVHVGYVFLTYLNKGLYLAK